MNKRGKKRRGGRDRCSCPCFCLLPCSLVLFLSFFRDPPGARRVFRGGPSSSRLAGAGGGGAADQFAQAAVLDARDGLGGTEPNTLAESVLGVGVADLGDVEEKHQDVTGDTALVVEIAADRVGVEHADKTRFFPGFLQGDLACCLAGLQATLGDDPALAIATGDQADLAAPDRDGRRLLKGARSDRHRASATRGDTSLP